MSSPNPNGLLSPGDYATAKDYLDGFAVAVLHWSAMQSRDERKEEIIWNLVARGTVCLDSIFLLWKMENFQDCWILQRALFDRYIHLEDLAEKNEFDEFERWSFQKQFEDTDVVLSDPIITGKLTPEELEKARGIHKERRKRYNKEPKSTWRRPRSEEVTKRSNQLILHRLGYNFPSSQVHPMADDGVYDFFRLIGWRHPVTRDTLGWAHEIYGDTRLIPHNSLLYMICLVKTGLETSDLIWKEFVFRFYEEALDFLDSRKTDYVSTCRDALSLSPDSAWCERR